MTKEQYKKLKVGDVVSLQLGRNKGEKATVTFIWDDEEDRSEVLFGLVEVKFDNPNLYNSTLNLTGGTTLSYKAFKYEGLSVSAGSFLFYI